MQLRVGDVENDDELNKKLSPYYHADKIRKPLLIAQVRVHVCVHEYICVCRFFLFNATWIRLASPADSTGVGMCMYVVFQGIGVEMNLQHDVRLMLFFFA